jgi:phage tail protein X
MATVYRCNDDEVLDAICYKHYGNSTPATELVLAANPGLADLGPAYAAGTLIFLPDIAEETIRPKIERKIRIFDTSEGY